MEAVEHVEKIRVNPGIGGSTYSDSEWANTPAGNFENYVLDVVHNVDHQFSTLPYRQNRVIAGFWPAPTARWTFACTLVVHVCLGPSVVGLLHADAFRGLLVSSPATLRYNSPIDEAPAMRAQIAAKGLRVFMFVGRDDESSRQIVPMARVLRAADCATVEYHIVGGGHDWSVWYPRLNQMLILASAATRRPPPYGLPTASRIHRGAELDRLSGRRRCASSRSRLPRRRRG